MTNQLSVYLTQNLQLEKYLVDKFVTGFKSEELRAKDHFLRAGEICNKIAFINKGAMYCVYNKEGVEKIDEFSFENEFITDYMSFLLSIPADKDIICIEPCQILTIHKDTLEKLYNEDKRFEKLGRLMAEGLFINWHLKAKSMILDDAETRYRNLLKSKPDLVQRVPQYLIASYLNVAPETISRIRKKYMEDLS